MYLLIAMYGAHGNVGNAAQILCTLYLIIVLCIGHTENILHSQKTSLPCLDLQHPSFTIQIVPTVFTCSYTWWYQPTCRIFSDVGRSRGLCFQQDSVKSLMCVGTFRGIDGRSPFWIRGRTLGALSTLEKGI